MAFRWSHRGLDEVDLAGGGKAETKLESEYVSALEACDEDVRREWWVAVDLQCYSVADVVGGATCVKTRLNSSSDGNTPLVECITQPPSVMMFSLSLAGVHVNDGRFVGVASSVEVGWTTLLESIVIVAKGRRGCILLRICVEFGHSSVETQVANIAITTDDAAESRMAKLAEMLFLSDFVIWTESTSSARPKNVPVVTNVE